MTARHVTNDPSPFAMVPEALLYDPAMSDKAVRLYGVLRRHGDDPADCYPSKRRLSDLMGCAASSLGRPLRELEEAGWITRVPRTKPGTGEPDSNGYHVHLARTSSATYAHQNAYPSAHQSAYVRAPERDEREPVNESQGNEKTPGGETLALVVDEVPAVDPFVVFWQSYPRKVAKPEARKAWGSVVAGKVDPTVVLDGLARWLPYWRSRRDDRFVPHPSTWLRQERWNDSPPSAGPATGQRAPVVSDRSRPSGEVAL